jgi:hypothetical protein
MQGARKVASWHVAAMLLASLLHWLETNYCPKIISFFRGKKWSFGS